MKRVKRCFRGDACVHPAGPYLPNTSDYFSPGRTVCRKCRSRDEMDRRRRREPYAKPVPSASINWQPHETPPRVVVAENAEGKRRALRFWEWDHVPDGWRVVGEGSYLLAEQWKE